MEHSEFLQKLGLGERESIVYLTLLPGGGAGVSQISRETGLYRTMVYEAIARL